MLNAYELRVRQLLQNPGAPSSLYVTSDIDSWINSARGQLAGEAECIRRIGTIQTAVGVNNYSFASLNFTDTSVAGAISIRRINYVVGQGQKFVRPRPWEWFDQFNLNNPVPSSSFPLTWAQYGQGSAAGATGSGASGSFYIDPPPDQVYTLNCDCVCFPIALINDSTVEAIPYLWTDAVPFFAAYYALLSAQTNARMADAERMFGYYTTFVQRARQFANPSVLRGQYEQSPDPTNAQRLGLVQKGGGNG
jgi:hypothetical protein